MAQHEGPPPRPRPAHGSGGLADPVLDLRRGEAMNVTERVRAAVNGDMQAGLGGARCGRRRLRRTFAFIAGCTVGASDGSVFNFPTLATLLAPKMLERCLALDAILQAHSHVRVLAYTNVSVYV
jgi:hypothetical protein